MAVATSCLRLVSRARLHLGDSASLKKPASRSPFANSTARPVPGTAAGWSATHRPARKGTAGCQNRSYRTPIRSLNLLRPVRDLLHVPRRELREDDETQGHHPAHDHRVRDRKAEGPGDLDRASRKALHSSEFCTVRASVTRRRPLERGMCEATDK